MIIKRSQSSSDNFIDFSLYIYIFCLKACILQTQLQQPEKNFELNQTQTKHFQYNINAQISIHFQ